MKKILISLVIVAVTASCAWGLANKADILYQLDISAQVTDHLQKVFDEFNDSFMDYQPALERISVLKNEYSKAIDPVPEEGEKLHLLMVQLLSRVENFFLHYKKTGREDVELNIKIVKTKFEITREATKLRCLTMSI